MTDLTTQQKLTIAQESSNALFRHLASSTVTLFDIVPVNGKHEVSSGTLIEIDGRTLIATASHNIPVNPEQRLWVLPEQPRKPDEGMLGFVSYGRHPVFDVGFLEVTTAALDAYLPGNKRSSLSSVRNLHEGRSNKLVTLMGFPEQFIENQQINGLPGFAVKLMSWSTTVTERSTWPIPPQGARPPDPDSDAFFDYPTEGNRLDTGDAIQLTTPLGFSGGGFWDQGFEAGELWSPESHALFAIQSCWFEGSRYIRATQIIHWLNLVRSKVPGVRAYLEASFPELKSMNLLA